MTLRKAARLLAAALILSIPPVAFAADEPEAVYEKFHAAGLAADFAAQVRYGSKARGEEMAGTPEPMRQMMLQMIAGMLPKRYRVLDKAIADGGNRATLRLAEGEAGATGGRTGAIVLLKEGGEWKVEEASWSRGESPR